MDERLIEYAATDRQRAVLEAVKAHGGVRAAARALGVRHNAVQQIITAVKKRATVGGYSPAHGLPRGLPVEYVAKGVSLYIDKQGKPAGHWLKGKLDQQAYASMVRDMLEGMFREAEGKAPKVPAPVYADEDLLSVYPLGDPHFGMAAWAAESGEAFDLEQARALTLGAVDHLVQKGPASGTAILLLLGDVYHMNDQSNLTPAHKHQLDASGRFGEVMQVGVETFVHAANALLKKHRRVIIRVVKGNHDPDAVWGLRLALAAWFRNEPRVTVDNTPAAHWYYRFGRVLIGATHGDSTQHKQLLGCMAVDRPQDWGATSHRYFYTGHVHSQHVTELPGLLCESFRTLAAADAYAQGHGYRAGRDMRLIVHHAEDGEIERYRCDAKRAVVA